MHYAILALVVFVFFAAVIHGARKFARDQQKLGRWDATGPLHPTLGPPRTPFGAGMDERIEISGKWKPVPTERPSSWDEGDEGEQPKHAERRRN